VVVAVGVGILAGREQVAEPGVHRVELEAVEQRSEAVAQVTLPSQTLSGAYPPVVERNARASGTDIAGYLTESPGFSTFVRDGDDVYHAYSTTWRGLEFVMGYYPILDHAPKGRDEGPDDWQLWIRRHDEYEREGVPA